MSEITASDKLTMEDGSVVTVRKLLGEGGQGEVWLVKDETGADYALKWYKARSIIDSEEFRNNLANNVKQGAPASSFLWPLKLTRRQKGSYGYLMNLRPERFRDMGEMTRTNKYKDSYFKSMEAKLNAAIQICNAFRNLHLKGFSYQDLNLGGFFLDFNTGDVLICDNDNVVADGYNMGVKGMVRYMAPEVVEGPGGTKGEKPSIASDCLSLALILYRLFMIDHPLEGSVTIRYPNMTAEKERKLFGREAIFCYDPNDDRNRPVPGVDVNSIKFWRLISPELQQMFQRALSRKALLDPKSRVKVREWKELFLKLRRNLVVCPAEGRDKPDFQFMADSTPAMCPKCRNTVNPMATLDFGNAGKYGFYRHKHLYLDDGTTPQGYGVSRRRPDTGTEEIALRNDSGDTWTLVTASKKVLQVKPGEVIPLRTGMELHFNSSYSCKITV